MTIVPRAAAPESPAHRLTIQYIASLSAIAVLIALGQAYVLRELASQHRTLAALLESAREQALGRSLSRCALEVQADDAPGPGRRCVAALREAVDAGRRDGPAPPGAVRSPFGPGRPGTAALWREAADRRRAAVRAAERLLARVGAGGAGAGPPPAALWPLTRAVVAEEDEAGRALGAAVLAAELEAAGHLRRLHALQLALLVSVMVVLALEGLYVISPAVRNLQRFMDEMRRAHQEVKTYAARLERSNRELQDFASVASHDLQEPLRKIQAFGDRLRSRCGGALDEQGRDYLDRVQNAARRMQALINDLLTFSRVTTKAQPFVPTDLAAAAREVVSDLEARIEQVRGRVEVGDLGAVDADPLQMRQLLQNLIGNALKYHRPEEPPVVTLSGRRFHAGHPPSGPHAAAREWCEIRVEDNGIGFDEAYADRIFTIFQRLHGRNEYEGTGIGLAVCRKIVERHGGTITARSTPGKGSTFLVTLPARHPKETPPDEHAA